MQLRILVTLIIGSAVAVSSALLWVRSEPLQWELLQPFGLVVSSVTVIAVLFEKVLWGLPIVRSMLAKRPTLAGTWLATLESSYRQPDGSPTIKEVYVVIAQTLTTLSVRVFTEKAHSFSLAERIRPSENDDLFELAIVYQNIPDIDQRLPDGTGRIHFGALIIPHIPYRAETLKGHYWTDRKTEGKLTLQERRRKLATSFDEARFLFEV